MRRVDKAMGLSGGPMQSDTMFAFAREPGGTAMSVGSAHGESSKTPMGGTGNPAMRPAFSTA